MEDHKVYLPKLKRIRIINYSLYSEDIDYEFIEGLNLIVGGNGVGKTTFINILKYALIGLYKKQLDVKNYKGEKRLTRESYKNSDSFFKNRTKRLDSDKYGFVELHFMINKVLFIVKRSLYEAKIIEANVIKNGFSTTIEGLPINQDSYKDYNDAEKNKNNLQFNYETLVAKEANLSDFDDFIFFVNQILFFGESRENVLWNEDAQERLMNAFFNDPKYEKQRKDFEFEAKYQDSLARHKQEEIKAINRVIEQINGDNSDNTDIKKSKISDEIDSLKRRQDSIEKKQAEVEKETKSYYKKTADLSTTINQKEKEKEQYDSQRINRLWKDLNPKYEIFKKQYEINKICPFCNSDLSSKNVNISSDECFFCHTKISDISDGNEKITDLKHEISNLISERTKYEKLIIENEKKLRKLDSEYRNLKIQLFDKNNILRSLESNENDNDDFSYQIMMNRINQLNKEKEEHQEKSEELLKNASEITKRIEDSLQKNTRNISNVFADFAGAFMKLPCCLTLESVKDKKVKDRVIKLFFPVIDNVARYDEEELSESQRFFVDYSFRMSILSFFYTTGSFYICETPDSSLDISYEENAADIFIKYISFPNVLIMTTNLNNTSFIKTILGKTQNKKILNLFKIGKVSEVQKRHDVLKKLSDELEDA
ncbi:MAG: AAA family ATPase [Treponemataceae bacterium]|nr:AAA family ATPase [Spirochaetales bacterium]MDY6030873.1 AAA family ATPase [Treponemataceae bacterium]